jgi:hypothetical protein
MSDDIIKKLKARILDVEDAHRLATHLLNDRLANLGQVVWDHRDEIIAALENQQAQKESHVVNHLS